ncbi:MAG: hypothetical protein V1773_06955 [bacterium]
MKKYLIKCLMFVLVLNLSIGCSVFRTKNIVPEKSSYNDYNIMGVVLLDSSIIEFNEAGGVYFCPVDNITGTSTDGEFLNISSLLIKQFRISFPESVTLGNLGNQPIREVLLKNGSLIIFNNQDGFYNSNEKEITGLSDDGLPVCVNIKKIEEIYANHPDKINHSALTKTTKLTQILLKENNILYTFDEEGGKNIQQKGKITGLTKDSLLVTVAADSVQFLKINKLDVAGTVIHNCFLAGGIFAGLYLTLIALIVFSGNGGHWN